MAYKLNNFSDNDSDISKYRDVSRYSKDGGSSRHEESNINKYSRAASSKKALSNNANNSASRRGMSPEDIEIEAAQYSRSLNRQYSHAHINQKKRQARKKRIIAGVCALFVLAVLGGCAYAFFPIKVSVNGTEQTLTVGKSLQDALDKSGIKVNPGNYVAVDYSVIKAGEGNKQYVEVNGVENEDTKTRLHNGYEITYSNGKDIMEDYTSVDSDITATATITGTGSLHKFSGTGEPGTWSKLTGKVTGKTAERQTKEPSNVTVKNYNANPGDDKVLCLTFDDGPSEEYTEQVLQLLAKYNAKATFFEIGENIEDYPNVTKAVYNAGHQICTHTYDHARNYGATDITSMPLEKRIQEITKGQSAIAKVIDNQPSKVCRLPGGNNDKSTALAIAEYVTAEIGWNVDTADWSRPGKDKILSAMKEATTGDVILCHDGGGDRSQTVEALKEFLPWATQNGYKFITIDEMMEYPESTKSSSNTDSSVTSTATGTSSGVKSYT